MCSYKGSFSSACPHPLLPEVYFEKELNSVYTSAEFLPTTKKALEKEFGLERCSSQLRGGIPTIFRIWPTHSLFQSCLSSVLTFKGPL